MILPSDPVVVRDCWNSDSQLGLLLLLLLPVSEFSEMGSHGQRSTAVPTPQDRPHQGNTSEKVDVKLYSDGGGAHFNALPTRQEKP